MIDLKHGGRTAGAAWMGDWEGKSDDLKKTEAPSPHPSPIGWERVAGGRVRGLLHGFQLFHSGFHLG